MTEEFGHDLQDEQGNIVKLNLEMSKQYLGITEPSEEREFFGRHVNIYYAKGALCVACYDGTDRSPVLLRIGQQDIDVVNLGRNM